MKNLFNKLTFFFFFITLLSGRSFANCKSKFSFMLNKEILTDQIARIHTYYPQGVIKPKNENDIIEAVRFAKDEKLKLSIKTGGFSQGGQWALNDGLILDLSEYKGFKFHKETNTYTAKAGTTWQEIQNQLHDRGYAVTVQQSSNIFPVGGALGMNAHGRDIHYGQIVNVTNWIKVLLPDGRIVKASPYNEHSDIFKKAIGGLGLRSVILEANLKVRPNKVYETIVLDNIKAQDIGKVFEIMRTKPHLLKKYITAESLKKISIDIDKITPDKIGLGYGRAKNLNPNKPDYLGEALFYMFVEVPSHKIKKEAKLNQKTKKTLSEYMMPFLMEIQRLSHNAKSFREFLERKLMRSSGAQANLNYLMNPPVWFLLGKQREVDRPYLVQLGIKVKKLIRRLFNIPVESTDILKEYFIPVENVEMFRLGLSKVIKKYNLNNLNITYRIVPKTPLDRTPHINYAPRDMVAFVLNFNIGVTKTELKEVDKWSKELVEEALNAQGIQYLAYGAHADLDQLIQGYPGITKIFDDILDNKDTDLFLNEYMKDYLRQYAKRR